MSPDSFLTEDADEEEQAAPQRLGPPRTHIEVICCPKCRSIHVTRSNSKGAIAYWRCNLCQWPWKEMATVGRHAAKIP